MSKKAKDDEELLECGETMRSTFDSHHKHTCIGKHPVGSREHFCGVCRRWWGRGQS